MSSETFKIRIHRAQHTPFGEELASVSQEVATHSALTPCVPLALSPPPPVKAPPTPPGPRALFQSRYCNFALVRRQLVDDAVRRKLPDVNFGKKNQWNVQSFYYFLKIFVLMNHHELQLIDLHSFVIAF